MQKLAIDANSSIAEIDDCSSALDVEVLTALFAAEREAVSDADLDGLPELDETTEVAAEDDKAEEEDTALEAIEVANVELPSKTKS